MSGTFDEMSRELALRCDPNGTVLWADGRAARLGIRAGKPLADFAAPATEHKIAQLVAEAARRPVSDWEVALVADGTPITVSFVGRPDEGGAALLGSLTPAHYADAFRQVAGAMSELAELHRESERQQHEISERHAQVLRLNRELTESGMGVVALHAEIDEHAQAVHRANESTRHVIANVSHEFRTPLNSILGLVRLLLDRADGDLTAEQEKQLGYILKSAEALSLMASDMLDLSKMEAGKVALRMTSFDVASFMGTLRGMLRPIVSTDQVALVFEDAPAGLAPLETDEGKLAQVLRNLISNALKFTTKGEVRVRAYAGPNDTVAFEVKDTGIGIAPEDQARIFDEFVQIEGPLQGKAKGTGLGLSLSRSLADLLGGEIHVRSEVGRGSTFTVILPRVHGDVREMAELHARAQVLEPGRAPVLVVEDDRQTLFLYEKYLKGSGFQVIPVRTIDEARGELKRFRPAAIVLDVMLEGETSWAFLAELKAHPGTRDIPTLVVTVTDREQKARALGADEFYVKPMEQAWLLRKLGALAAHGPVEKVLVIDDDDVARYLVKKFLAGTAYSVLEASNGSDGIRLAQREHPHVIFLDFLMPEMSAFEVIDELKKDPVTRGIPIIINTSQSLEAEERARLAAETSAIISKQSLSREVAIGRIREALVKAGIRPAPHH